MESKLTMAVFIYLSGSKMGLNSEEHFNVHEVLDIYPSIV